MNDKEKRILSLFKEYAFKVIKEPTGKCKYHFVEPGLAYHNTLWDWDSYYSLLALNDLCDLLKDDKDFDYKKYKELVAIAAKGNVLNFLDFQEDNGFVPIMIRVDVDNDTYASYQNVGNANKGYLVKSCLLAAKLNNDYSFIDVEKLEKYFKFLKTNQYDEKSGLYVYKTDIMIGIDNNPTVFGRPSSSTAEIMFNSAMVDEFKSMIEILKQKGLDFSYYRKEKEDLIKKINEEMYDKKDCLFYSQDVNVNTNVTKDFNHGLPVFWKTMPLKIETFACYAPLMYGFVDKKIAMKVIERLDQDGINSKYGIRSLSKYEKMYDLTPSGNPSNWLGAIWGISNYVGFMAYYKYQEYDKAIGLYNKVLNLYNNSIKQDGSLYESYNPETGKGILHKMFFSWNMLIVNMIKIVKQLGKK